MSSRPRSINLSPRRMSAVVETDGIGGVVFAQNDGFASVALSGVQGIMLLSYLAPASDTIGVATCTRIDGTIASARVRPDTPARCTITIRDAAGALIDLANVDVRVAVHVNVVP